MHFKTIFTVSLLALFSTVNADPVGIKRSIIPAGFNKRAVVPQDNVEIRQEAKENLAHYEEECRLRDGKLLSSMDMEKYICLHGYWDETDDINYDNAVCFYASDVPYCINNKITNIKECVKGTEDYSFKACMKKFIFGPIKLNMRLRTYPDRKRIESSPRLDNEECRFNEGIPIMKNVKDYICLNPEDKTENPKKEHCVKVEDAKSKKVEKYCVFQENTSIKECNKSSDVYDHDKCNKMIVEYSEGLYSKATKN